MPTIVLRTLVALLLTVRMVQGWTGTLEGTALWQAAGVFAVGLLVSIFQAVTQIHEATLSFVPKLVVVGISLVIFGGMMMGLLSDFMIDIFARIPDLVK